MAEHGVLVENGPFAAGEISVHSAHCLHTVRAPTATKTARMALSISGGLAQFMPGVQPGEIVAIEYNPVIDRPNTHRPDNQNPQDGVV